MAQPSGADSAGPPPIEQQYAQSREELAKSVAQYAASLASSAPDVEALTCMACQAIDCDDVASFERILSLGLKPAATVISPSQTTEQQAARAEEATPTRLRVLRGICLRKSINSVLLFAVENSLHSLAPLRMFIEEAGVDADRTIEAKGQDVSLLNYACSLPGMPSAAISLLLAHGADPRKCTDSPLRVAVRAENSHLIRLLAASVPAAPFVLTGIGWQGALLEATHRGSERCVQELLALDTDSRLMRQWDRDKLQPLSVALSRSDNARLMQLLYDHGAYVHPALAYLTPNLSVDTLQWLLAHGSGVQGALHAAASTSVAHVRLLLQWGADPNGLQRDCSSPLHHCTHEASCELLLLAGACVSARNRLGRTPLYNAAQRANEGVAGVLLRWGAMAYEQPEDVRTFLNYFRNPTLILDATKQKLL